MNVWMKRGLRTALVTGGLLAVGTGVASADENDLVVDVTGVTVTVPVADDAVLDLPLVTGTGADLAVGGGTEPLLELPVDTNTPTGQAGSRQRHNRACQMSRTGTPKAGASATTRRRRPWPTATTPHEGQPLVSASDSMVRTNLMSSRRMVRTCMSGTSNRRSVRGHQDALEAHVEWSTSRPSLRSAWSLPILKASTPSARDRHAGPRQTRSPTLNSEEPLISACPPTHGPNGAPRRRHGPLPRRVRLRRRANSPTATPCPCAAALRRLSRPLGLRDT